MSRYVLMNKDKEIAKINCGLDYVGYNVSIAKHPDYIFDIHSWIYDRCNYYHRHNIKDIVTIGSFKLCSEYLTVTKAISLTDTFWVNDLLNPVKWSEINPYTNRLSKIHSEIALDSTTNYNNQILSITSPQLQLDGQTEKCVKRVNGKFVLYKTAGEVWTHNSIYRPYAEYFASKFANMIGIQSCVNYNIIERINIRGELQPYCTCEMFTNENIGLMQMKYTKYGILGIDAVHDLLSDNYKVQLKNMALLDSIILNIDRHQGNYGFLYDNNTFNIVALAPIYDNDCSLGSTISLQDKDFDEAYDEIVKHKLPKLDDWNYDEQALWGMTNAMYKILKNVGKIELKKPSNIRGLSDRRVAFMNYIINRRIKEILSLI